MVADCSYISRHMVVCRAAKKLAHNTREYINREKENSIFAPVLPLRNKMNFAVDMPTNFSTPNTKFGQNRASSVPEICDFKNWLIVSKIQICYTKF